MNRTMRQLGFVVAGLAAIAAVSPGVARAQVTQAPLEVSAIVLNTCTISALPLAFVDYEPLGGSPTTATTEITVLTCFDPHEIAINDCTHGTGTADRKLQSLLTTDTLDYSLSCLSEGDAECVGNWGEQQGTDTLTGVGGALQLYTVDGVIPTGQEVPSGVYTDSCTVSLQF